MDRKRRGFKSFLRVTSFVVAGFVTCLVFSFPAEAKQSYKKVLRQWTEEGSNYELDNLEAQLVWNVTYKGWPLREKQLSEQARFSHFSEREVLEKKIAEKSEFAQYDDFFASIYAGSSTLSQVGKNPKMWRFQLLLPDGQRIEALSVTKIKPNELDLYFYPYINKWSTTYLIRFPKSITPTTGQFELVLGGIPSGDTLTFKVP